MLHTPITIDNTNSNNVCDTLIYSRGRGTPCPYNLLHSFFQLVLLNKKPNNNFGGGLGDATVTQSGVWGRIPQFFWLL
ncbi:hypothetical protein FDUTEX481_01626 [Tolypothrix sp. PCC 7601]|nr:hypothetical protein FDUTEX481_01626 [Tolypothrix sp. PCC 7601]